MKSQLAFALGLFLLAPLAMAQRPQAPAPMPHPMPPSPTAPRANGGRIPPPPAKRDNPHAKPEAERHTNGKVNETQHVNNDKWYGHDRPDDKRYHLDHPFEHGRFEHFGPDYRYRIVRIDRERHWFWFPGGYYFWVADWDWPICMDWCWDCDDDFVVYEDPDHIGWYLLYNIHTGVYVHVMYMGT